MSFYKSRWVESVRKLQTCWWCGQKIEPGQRAHYYSTIFEGDLHTGHSHPECKAAVDSLPYDGEGYEPFTHSRGRTDDEKGEPVFPSDYRGRQP